MFNLKIWTVLFAPVWLATQTAALWSQNKTLDRVVDPVVVTGEQLIDFFGVPLSELALFSYDATTNAWNPIPFQIDEKNTADEYVFPGMADDVAGLDGNDELIFMAQDAGDQAFVWLNDVSSQEFVRYEIAVSDSLDPGNVKEGWVYLYRGVAAAKVNTADYVSYTPSPDPSTGQDLVEGGTYKLGGDARGLFGDLFLASDPTKDLLAGQQLRGKASALFFSLNFNEQNDLEFVGIRVIDGAVRVLRELTFSLLGELTVAVPAQYFRYSVTVGGTVNIPPEIKVFGISVSVKEIRHSLNFSDAVAGGFFSSRNNTNVPIDGNGDTIDDALVYTPEINFIHIAGEASALAKGSRAFQGTIVNLFSLPNTIGDSQTLFYVDDAEGAQYANSGVFISGSDIEGEFPLGLELILFADNQPVSVAQQLTANAENPLHVQTVSQDFSTVPVELVSFEANVEKNTVVLRWVTASETDNFGFEVERRPAQREWERIGFVAGNGTTTLPNEYRFTDEGLQPGSYEYRLKQIDTNGSFEYSGIVTAEVGLPEVFLVHQNFPNPFNPETEIRYEIPAVRGGGSVRTVVSVYNLLGQPVRTLVDEQQTPGYYAVRWDGRDRFGNAAPSGVYLYRVQAGTFASTRKMILVR